MSDLSLSDLRRLYYGGGSDAEYAHLLELYEDDISADDILTAVQTVLDGSLSTDIETLNAAAAIVAGAPAALNTLDELAAALGDDANFAATVTTALANKQPLDADLTSLSAGGATALAWLQGLLDAVYSGVAHTHGTYALLADPPGWGIPFTCDPMFAEGTVNIGTANNAYHWRSKGGGTITKLAIRVGTSADSISLAVSRGTVGRAGPTARVATTGVVPCPASGYAEVSLGGSVAVNATTDWLGISCDGTSATFRAGYSNANGLNDIFLGFLGAQTTSHPIPASPSTTPNQGKPPIIIIGVA